ncbi:SDR family NAD(P)-dependent oxidoreductase [Microbulbifer sp. YPW1]|uniref:SDR family NAD(P)-dependent oxidoreductase n=1 Tax=Microbulbifer sp. YPW1 TaxID=2745199 RepID=UPI001598B66C|nr:SDR family NAD(P)-dependent oxidoreductase [Microbulbifer sp. YPW1]QKX17215.1 SDR family NAD(P)-dependent oxidoreductase [Microbulbifer sp. YPW1]
MSKLFQDKVAIVTGAGNGLGKSHALALARLGAKVVVNDLGGDRAGQGASATAAQQVVEEIQAAGGTALVDGGDITRFADAEAMVQKALDAWGRVDILINNAGILRDKSFAKMDLADFRSVLEVHLMGTVNCCKAVWEPMRAQNYGRILMTTSASGLYGNFGQSNYGAAKMAVVGLMNTLRLEGAKNNIHVNALAPTAATRMTEDLLPPDFANLLSTESVTAGALAMCTEEAPSGEILCAGGGCYSRTTIFETEGVFVRPESQNAEHVAGQWQQIADTTTQHNLDNAAGQTERFIRKALTALQHGAAKAEA